MLAPFHRLNAETFMVESAVSQMNENTITKRNRFRHSSRFVTNLDALRTRSEI
jgi:hypothetical protein